MKKEIYLIAYTQTNLGDDLFVRMLCKRYPNTVFYLNVPAAHSRAFTDLKNLVPIANVQTGLRLDRMAESDNYLISFCGKALRRIRRKLNDAAAKRKMKNADAIVKIGGSIYMEKALDAGEPLNLDTLEPLDYIPAQREHKKSYFIIGANLGPIFTEEYLYRVRKQIADVTGVTFRDWTSYRVFQQYPQAAWAPDVLFGLPTDHLLREEKKQVFIAPVDLQFECPQASKEEIRAYYCAYQSLCTYYISQGLDVVLASFCSAEWDNVAVCQIWEGLSSGQQQKVKTIEYNGDTDQVLMELARSEYVICGRFHAMILSMVMGTPFFPVCYSEKMNHVLKDIAFTGQWCNISKFSEKAPAQIDVNRISGCTVPVENLRTGALRQFAQLDEFLSRG